MDFVKLYAKVAYKFTGKPQRENIYEYSFEAIREAVINSVMHKNYFEHGHNNILKFFPDRIQIENIWIKPSHFILGKTVFRRNKVIAALFSRIHFGEKLGSGMKRMREYCKKENAPFPKIDFTGIHFYIVFKPTRSYLEMIRDKEIVRESSQKKWSEKAKEINAKFGGKFGERFGENQIKILDLINRNSNISIPQIANELSLTTRAIEKNIAKLKQKELLKRIGPAKGGHWEVMKK